MKTFVNLISNRIFHLFIIIAGIAGDQLSKILAVSELGDIRGPDGFLYSSQPFKVVSDWFWIHLAYNRGAAFSSAPQKLLPFLSPDIFYTLVACGAFAALLVLYRRRPFPHVAMRIGIPMVIAGGIGNLIDRWRLGRVVDFISWGVPGCEWRWPTFNIADSLICVGVAILLLADVLDIRVFRTRASKEPPQA